MITCLNNSVKETWIGVRAATVHRRKLPSTSTSVAICRNPAPRVATTRMRVKVTNTPFCRCRPRFSGTTSPLSSSSHTREGSGRSFRRPLPRRTSIRVLSTPIRLPWLAEASVMRHDPRRLVELPMPRMRQTDAFLLGEDLRLWEESGFF